MICKAYSKHDYIVHAVLLWGKQHDRVNVVLLLMDIKSTLAQLQTIVFRPILIIRDFKLETSKTKSCLNNNYILLILVFVIS